MLNSVLNLRVQTVCFLLYAVPDCKVKVLLCTEEFWFNGKI
jgi:hypothetical protein